MSKISKTKLNTVSPDDIIEEFGADTMRLNILSDNPPDQEQVWSDDAVKGAYKFINRFYTLAMEHMDAINSPEAREGGPAGDADRDVLRKVHQTIRKVTDCIEKDLHFNTAIASVFELVNKFRAADGISPYTQREVIRNVVLLLAPITPHVSEELWHRMGEEGSIFRHAWPEADLDLAAEETVDVVLQVNGKVRSRMTVSVSATKEELEGAALADEKIKALVEGHDVKKIIVVPSRLVNIVI
jgi:leucyl-tRNA synthetase